MVLSRLLPSGGFPFVIGTGSHFLVLKSFLMDNEVNLIYEKLITTQLEEEEIRIALKVFREVIDRGNNSLIKTTIHPTLQ